MNPLLEVEDLWVNYTSPQTKIYAVQGVSFSLFQGEILGIVGESGSGKSSLLQALLPFSKNRQIFYKKCNFLGKDLSSLSLKKDLYKTIGWVSQNPLQALHPYKKIEKQLTEGLIYHKILSKKQALEKMADLLSELGILDPLRYMSLYPHELSGGICQRILLALALSFNPTLLIADEPTSALDVILQKKCLQVLQKIHHLYQTTLILISHDIGFLSKICDRILVMYAGKKVEEQKTAILLQNPLHPYTKGLLQSHLGLQSKDLSPIPGNLPLLHKPFLACPFASRCMDAKNICQDKLPPNLLVREGNVCCWKYDTRSVYVSSSSQKLDEKVPS